MRAGPGSGYDLTDNENAAKIYAKLAYEGYGEFVKDFESKSSERELKITGEVPDSDKLKDMYSKSNEEIKDKGLRSYLLDAQ